MFPGYNPDQHKNAATDIDLSVHSGDASKTTLEQSIVSKNTPK